VAYDVIIAGASFAGLAVASQLRGRVLLLDRKDIGTHQTSACATPLEVVQTLRCEDAVLQTFDRILLHTASRTVDYSTSYRFCTFDYQEFCAILASRLEVDIIKARALGLDGQRVVTDAGAFEAPIVVDCTGWRATLARSLRTAYATRLKRSFGFETVLPWSDSALHVWVDPQAVDKGFIWAFPCGARTRFGVASYRGKPNIRRELEQFLTRYGLEADEIQGGYFPHNRGEPTLAHLFLVGDSAGQCAALTGEGIRPALYFGAECGRAVQRALDGEFTLEAARRQYREAVRRRNKYFTALRLLQRMVLTIPNSGLTAVAMFTARPRVLGYVLGACQRMAPIGSLP